MANQDVPITQPGDPTPEPEAETEELLAATGADGDDIDDTSEGVPQDHRPPDGAPS